MDLHVFFLVQVKMKGNYNLSKNTSLMSASSKGVGLQCVSKSQLECNHRIHSSALADVFLMEEPSIYGVYDLRRISLIMLSINAIERTYQSLIKGACLRKFNPWMEISLIFSHNPNNACVFPQVWECQN